MNRMQYYNYIEQELCILSFRIEKRSKLNLLELNIHSETFFAELMNKIFNLKFKNLNSEVHNNEAIDLIDKDNKIIAQVSSTCTKQKIEKSLAKKSLEKYSNYNFLFIAISGDSKKLLNKKFKTPSNLNFIPEENIYDINSILSEIFHMEIEDLYELNEFIKKELGSINGEYNNSELPSDLVKVIQIISNNSFKEYLKKEIPLAFKMQEKIDNNNLIEYGDIVKRYNTFFPLLQSIYDTYDEEAVNTSDAVWEKISEIARELSITKKFEGDLLFKSICNRVFEYVKGSSVLKDLSKERVEMCVNIIVVDAFLRCKIMRVSQENEGEIYAVTQ